MMYRRNLLRALGAGALAHVLTHVLANAPAYAFNAYAQSGTGGSANPLERTLRIGWLAPGTAASQTVLLNVLRSGLRDIGYVEGNNLVIEARWADGNSERVPQLARELAARKVAAIVTVFTATAAAAKQVVSDVPVIFTLVSDPVFAGLVKSLGRPEGNITGLASLNIELAAKRLEILNEIVPAAKRIAFFYRSDLPTDRGKLEATQQGARILGVQLLPIDLHRSTAAAAFKQAAASGAKAAMVVLNSSSFDNRHEIVSLAAKYRLATIYETPVLVDDGGLVSYSVSQYAQIGRAAYYLDKLHKGAKVRELPVEQAAVLEFAINQKTAKALGLKFPYIVLLRVTKVIE